MLSKFKFFNLLALTSVFFFCLSACQPSDSRKTTVGIILPIEHTALRAIAQGFMETLSKESPVPIVFKTANAQGDINLQQAIIQQMKTGPYDLIVPIGTTTTQMAVNLIRHKPILSLASTYGEKERKQLKNCNLVVVHDEVPAHYLIDFIHRAFPSIKHLTLIHSANDKVYPEIASALAAGSTNHIVIKPLLVPSLNELYSIANSLPQETQGIIILKDSLIASGVGTLVQTAKKRQLLLASSDQGSVEDGVSFGLGVKEKQIGISGANLAATILNGKPVCDIPISEVKELQVFVNKQQLKSSHVIEQLRTAANSLHYHLEYVN